MLHWESLKSAEYIATYEVYMKNALLAILQDLKRVPYPSYGNHIYLMLSSWRLT